jgi:hypothetical protein
MDLPSGSHSNICKTGLNITKKIKNIFKRKLSKIVAKKMLVKHMLIKMTITPIASIFSSRFIAGDKRKLSPARLRANLCRFGPYSSLQFADLHFITVSIEGRS